MMTPEQEEIVALARSKIVKLHRAGLGGYDAPDHKSAPWYDPKEWDDEGNYYGPVKAMFPVPVNKASEKEEMLTTEDGDLLTNKKQDRKGYMKEYMRKKREKEC